MWSKLHLIILLFIVYLSYVILTIIFNNSYIITLILFRKIYISYLYIIIIIIHNCILAYILNKVDKIDIIIKYFFNEIKNILLTCIHSFINDLKLIFLDVISIFSLTIIICLFFTNMHNLQKSINIIISVLTNYRFIIVMLYIIRLCLRLIVIMVMILIIFILHKLVPWINKFITRPNRLALLDLLKKLPEYNLLIDKFNN